MDQFAAAPASQSEDTDAAPSSLWAYIEDMLGELAGLASTNGAPALATLISMAALEAARTESQMNAT